jgi:hypothetical protein
VHGALKQGTEGGAFQSDDAEFGKKLLLPDAQPEGVLTEFGFALGTRFDYGLLRDWPGGLAAHWTCFPC